MRNVRRKQVKEDRKKRGIVFLTFAVLLFIYFTVNMVIGDNGLLKYMELKKIRDRLKAETSAMQAQNEDAKEQIDSMKSEPELVEELAREYGLTREGELIFKFEDK